MPYARSFLLAGLTVSVVLGAPAAHANTVTLLDTYEAVGPPGPVNSASLPPLTLQSGGELEVTLSPVAFGAPLSALSFKLVDAQGAQLALMSGTGASALTDTIGAAAGTYYALSYGQTSGATGAAGIGFYGLSVTYIPISAVPLPGSAVLLASALATLGLLVRRRWTTGGPYPAPPAALTARQQ